MANSITYTWSTVYSSWTHENIDRLQAAMPGLRRAVAAEQPEIGGLVRLSIDQVSIDG